MVSGTARRKTGSLQMPDCFLQHTFRRSMKNRQFYFDFRNVDIPLSKKVLDFKDSSTFSFSVEHVERNGNDWVVTETRPEIRITVSGENPAQERIIIGYRSHEAGVFYYRIREIPGDELFLYDTAVFLVEVTVADGKAEITGIQRNGVDTEEIAFTNWAVTTLTVTKTITGGAGSTKFPFRAEIYLEDEPFFLRRKTITGAFLK